MNLYRALIVGATAAILGGLAPATNGQVLPKSLARKGLGETITPPKPDNSGGLVNPPVPPSSVDFSAKQLQPRGFLGIYPYATIRQSNQNPSTGILTAREVNGYLLSGDLSFPIAPKVRVRPTKTGQSGQPTTVATEGTSRAAPTAFVSLGGYYWRFAGQQVTEVHAAYDQFVSKADNVSLGVQAGPVWTPTGTDAQVFATIGADLPWIKSRGESLIRVSGGIGPYFAQGAGTSPAYSVSLAVRLTDRANLLLSYWEIIGGGGAVFSNRLDAESGGRFMAGVGLKF